MFEGLRRDARLASLIPFVRQFYRRDSTYIFYDHVGQAHELAQTQSGEQGDPLMPGLFAVGIHWPFWRRTPNSGHMPTFMRSWMIRMWHATQRTHAPRSSPCARRSIKRHANIDVHLGKRRVWNPRGEQPPGLAEVLPTAPVLPAA